MNAEEVLLILHCWLQARSGLIEPYRSQYATSTIEAAMKQVKKWKELAEE
jgi:hypothetical protein